MAKTKVTEQKLQNSIIKALNAIGFHVWRCNSGAIFIGKRMIRMAPKGTPDIIGFDSYGNFVALEVKLPGKELRKEQKEWIDAARESAVDADVVHGLDEALGWAAEHFKTVDEMRGLR